MNLPSLETPRLVLRTYLDEDLDDFHAIRSDPVIRRYYPPHFSPPEKSPEILHRHLVRWRENGFGEFGAFEKASGKLIGYCGLQNLDGGDEIEIYYGYAQTAWGKGFATEAAAAVLEFGFREAGLEEIVAVTHPENIASQNVLQKIGLRFEKEIICYRMNCRYFRLGREDHFE
ncbi:MAG: GNAT family N-acetyltransferase [Pyrinomonadaceae bacterium]